MGEKLFQEGDQKEEEKFLPNQILTMIKFTSLNKSSQFLNILRKKKLDNKYFTIFFEKNYKNVKNNNKNLNISFVMKKKIGNAVIRNKIKRKLKSAVQKISMKKHLIDLNCTYVIFGKNNVYKDKFDLVLNEMNDTFLKVKKFNN